MKIYGQGPCPKGKLPDLQILESWQIIPVGKVKPSPNTGNLLEDRIWSFTPSKQEVDGISQKNKEKKEVEGLATECKEEPNRW